MGDVEKHEQVWRSGIGPRGVDSWPEQGLGEDALGEGEVSPSQVSQFRDAPDSHSGRAIEVPVCRVAKGGQRAGQPSRGQEDVMAQEGYAGGGSGKTQAALNLSVECSEGGFASERWCERPVLPSAENWVERRTAGRGGGQAVPFCPQCKPRPSRWRCSRPRRWSFAASAGVVMPAREGARLLGANHGKCLGRPPELASPPLHLACAQPPAMALAARPHPLPQGRPHCLLG